MRSDLSTTELVERANGVSIHTILQDFFNLGVPESGEGRSYKTRCPFAFEHGDGGISRSYRVYTSTNSSYCFDMHGSLAPVRLVAVRYDLGYRVSAMRILSKYNLLRPRPWWERYADLVKERETRTTDIGSPAFLVEALNSAMREHPMYVQRAYDDDVLAFVEKALEELEVLMAGHVSPDEVRAWYRRVREQTLSLLSEEAS